MRCSTRALHVVLAGMLTAGLLLAGCGPRILQSTKEAHRQGRFAEVAATEVSCGPADDRCNQMHLLKGDACYRLGRKAEQAGADSTARTRFRCAARHLGAGIRQTEGAADWTIAGGDRTQWYTNRAESLRQLQDLLTGDSARAVSRRLLDFGRTYRRAAPGAAAPPFYVATARYALLQPRLLNAPAGDDEVCSALDSIRTVLDEAPSVPDSVSTVQEALPRLRRQVVRQRTRLDCSS
ncbi:MAG: hypothetical protein ABEL97_09355 [Salinibacter sp.]